MRWRTIIGCAMVSCLFSALAMWPAPAGSGSSDRAAVAASSQSASASVPPLIRFNAAAADFRSSTQNITFLLYGSAQSATPLWNETQQVQIDDQGNYTVMLGSTRAEGLPLELFTNGSAVWLGVQVADQPEQPRTLMVAVPYAFKAAEAETLGGLPASAFLLAPQAATVPGGQSGGASAPAPGNSAPSTTSPNSSPGNTPAGEANSPHSVPAVVPCASLMSDGTGTTNQLVKFTAPCNTTKSALTESGGKVGIGTTTPAGTLDVNGGALVRGTLQLPAKGTAAAVSGFTSQPQDWQASAFSSATHAAQTQHLLWQAEPTGNNTATPSAKLSLLAAAGAALPAESGLSISSKGLIKFAPGQTFPGTGPGTITGVTAGTDLTGGGTSGVVKLNLNTALTDARYARLAANNSFTGNQSVTGNLTASGSVSGNQLVSTAATGTAPFSVSSTTQVANLNATLLDGMAASGFATTGANSFTGDQTINGNLVVPGSGNVAIGTTSANAKLDIAGGDVLAERNLTVNGSLAISTGNETIHGSLTATAASGAAIMGSGGSGLNGNGAAGVVGNGGTAPDPTAFGGRGATFRGGNAGDTVVNGGDGGDGVSGTGGGGSIGGAGGFFLGGDSVSHDGGAGIIVGGGNGNIFGGDGIDASAGSGSTNGFAGFFNGDVNVEGTLSAFTLVATATKDFKIENPVDPTKYLLHASVESSEMKNIYDGVAVMDQKGEAVVTLPRWFQALNGDFRYQLTCIGGWAPVYIKRKIDHNKFTIAGGNPGMQVSWQVTGVRHDAAAKAHPLVVEMAKSDDPFYRREAARAKLNAAARRRDAPAIRPTAARPTT